VAQVRWGYVPAIGAKPVLELAIGSDGLFQVGHERALCAYN